MTANSADPDEVAHYCIIIMIMSHLIWIHPVCNFDFASNSSNRFYARKILKNQTLILIVWCSVRNSTSRNRKIYMTPSVGLPAQMVVCFNPEQLFPIQ